MGGSSKQQTVGYRYFLGTHLILSHGPVDKVLRFLFDRRPALTGNYTGGQVYIDAPNLYGGENREGGVSGYVDIEMGHPSQGQNSYLASRVDANITNFRGVFGLVFRQFYMGINPYIKPISVYAQRIFVRQNGLAQWYKSKAAVGNFSFSQTYVNYERFTDWPTPYVFGNDPTFYTLVTTPYGNGIKVTNKAITTNEYCQRTIPASNYERIVFKGKLDVNAAGSEGTDADICYFSIGTLSFILSRDATSTGSNERAYLNGAFIGSTPMVVGSWYTFDCTLNWSTSQVTCTVTRDSDGAELGSVTVGFISTSPFSTLSLGSDVAPGERMNDAGTIADIQLFYGGVAHWSDMNPAHIIRECLTDPDWGMGYQESDIDDTSFRAAADTLYTEGMGISILWDKQISIEEFIREILRHIDASVYVDRSTGLFVLKLIRNDYDEESLLELGPHNIVRVDNYSTTAFGELVNSVTVNYLDNITGEDGSISADDPALIQLQGAVIGTTISYPGFTNKEMAAKIAARDLRSLSTPLISCTIIANRDAEQLNIGSTFKFEWPDYHDGQIVMRVTGMAFGDGRSHTVRVSCTQDVFDMPEVAVTTPQPPVWVDPNSDAVPADYRIVIEAPYYELVQRLGQTTADEQTIANPGIAYLLASAAAPAGAINARLAIDAGAGYDGNDTPMDFCPIAFLDEDVDYTETVISIENGVALSSVTIGTHVQIGSELMRVDAVSETQIEVGRGVLDTVPTTHSAGDVVFFWDAFADSDGVEYVEGESIDVKILPTTGHGTLATADAPTDEVTFVGRAARPYAPGNLKVGGVAYPNYIAHNDELDLSWSHRDRVQQTAGEIYDTTDGNIGPEPGTEYNIRIYGETGTLLRDVTQSTTTYLYPIDEEKDESMIPGSGNPVESAWITELTGLTSSSYLSTAYLNAAKTALYAGGVFNQSGTTSGDFLAFSLNPDTGAVNWQYTYAHSGYEACTGFAVDSNDRLRFAGVIYTPSPGVYSVSALTLNSDGTHYSHYSTGFGAAGYSNYYYTSHPADSGGVYHAGFSQSAYTYRGVIVRYDSTGAPQNYIVLPGLYTPHLGRFARHGGYIYITAFTASAPYQAVTLKVNDALTAVSWARKYTKAAGDCYSYGCVVDSSGNTYALCIHGGNTSYVVKHDDSGALVWQRKISHATAVSILSIGITPTGHIMLLGVHASQLCYLKLDSSGNVVWQKKLAHSSGASSCGYGLHCDGESAYFGGNRGTATVALIGRLPTGLTFANGTYGAWTVTDGVLTVGAGDLTESALSITPSTGSPWSASSVTATGTSRSFSNSTATIQAGDSGDYRANGRLRVELESVRDTLISYQKHNYVVRRSGYGFNYGDFYGV